MSNSVKRLCRNWSRIWACRSPKPSRLLERSSFVRLVQFAKITFKASKEVLVSWLLASSSVVNFWYWASGGINYFMTKSDR